MSDRVRGSRRRVRGLPFNALNMLLGARQENPESCCRPTADDRRSRNGLLGTLGGVRDGQQANDEILHVVIGLPIRSQLSDHGPQGIGCLRDEVIDLRIDGEPVGAYELKDTLQMVAQSRVLYQADVIGRSLHTMDSAKGRVDLLHIGK